MNQIWSETESLSGRSDRVKPHRRCQRQNHLSPMSRWAQALKHQWNFLCLYRELLCPPSSSFTSPYQSGRAVRKRVNDGSLLLRVTAAQTCLIPQTRRTMAALGRVFALAALLALAHTHSEYTQTDLLLNFAAWRFSTLQKKQKTTLLRTSKEFCNFMTFSSIEWEVHLPESKKHRLIKIKINTIRP